MLPCQSRWSCADVEHGRGVGFEAFDAIELEAGQFEHPDLGQLRSTRRLAIAASAGASDVRIRFADIVGGGGVDRVEPLGQRLQHRRPDVAGHRDRLPVLLDQQRGHRGGRRLAVGAGDGQHLRRIAALGLQVGQRGDEQVEFALHRDAGGACGSEQRRDALVVRRQARALQHQVDAVEHRGSRARRPAADAAAIARQAACVRQLVGAAARRPRR